MKVLMIQVIQYLNKSIPFIDPTAISVPAELLPSPIMIMMVIRMSM